MKVDQYLLNIPSQKIKYGLTRTRELLKLCGDPHNDFFSIQILGTNGKGSTCAFLNNIFIQANYRVGLFTSPHLVDYKERIQVNSTHIPIRAIEIFLKKHQKQLDALSPSFFEIMTVLAVWYFKHKKVDVAILETGLGGKLDSVTACNNQILGFTNIDIDHQEILGNSIHEIAVQKTLAINNSSQKVFSVLQKKSVEKVLLDRCKTKKVFCLNQISPIKTNKLHLKGKHQKINAGLAKAIAEHCATKSTFNIKEDQILNSLSDTLWPGRFEIINFNPTIIYDVAHNNAGIKSFIATYSKHVKRKKYTKKYLLCGFQVNKNINKTIILLNDLFDEIICTETGIRSSKKSEEMLHYFDCEKGKNIQNVKEALTYLISTATQNDLICVLGSHYFGPYIYKEVNKSFANKD